ncbi:MAG: hypothetical protein ACI91R_002404, partial [Vicingaceae bacterium]
KTQSYKDIFLVWEIFSLDRNEKTTIKKASFY